MFTNGVVMSIVQGIMHVYERGSYEYSPGNNACLRTEQKLNKNERGSYEYSLGNNACFRGCIGYSGQAIHMYTVSHRLTYFRGCIA